MLFTKQFTNNSIPIQSRMKNRLQEELIRTILMHIPEGQNSTVYISNILNLEREYVYRRLRGDTNFTIEEVALLSIKLGFSVDNIVKLKRHEATIFELHFLDIEEREDMYFKKIERNSRIIAEINSAADDAKIRWAGNTIPFAIFNQYETLNKFHFYKWVYQTAPFNSQKTFSDFLISDALTKKLQSYHLKLQPLSHMIFIVDNNFISSVISNIEYFHARGLITNIEVKLLKDELLDVVKHIEGLATNGLLSNGGWFDLYLSPVNINSSYTHVEYGDKSSCQYLVYTVNTLNSDDKEVCRIQKEWIESLKRHSTLVTQCNELERYKYFDEQRKIINHLNKTV